MEVRQLLEKTTALYVQEVRIYHFAQQSEHRNQQARGYGFEMMTGIKKVVCLWWQVTVIILDMTCQESITVSYEPFDCRPKIRYLRPQSIDSAKLLVDESCGDIVLGKDSNQYQNGLLACDSVSQVVNYVNNNRQVMDSLSISAVLASISTTNTLQKNSKHNQYGKKIKRTYKGLWACLRPQSNDWCDMPPS